MPIPGFRGARPLTVIKKAVNDFIDDDLPTYAAALAYQVLFSIFPFIIFLVALLGFLHLSDFFDWLRLQLAAVVPQQAMDQVNQVIDQLQQPQGGLLSFGVVVALWTASAAIRAVVHALNIAYDVRERRPAWKLYPLSILYTIGIAAMLTASAALLIVGPGAMEWLARQVGMERIFVVVWAWLRLPAALLLLTLAVAALYYVAPDVEQEFRFITPGAVLCVMVWVAGTVGFDYYVRNFADYNATYGSVGAVIVLLTYFYISAAVFLFGAEVNAAIEYTSPEGKKPGEKTIH